METVTFRKPRLVALALLVILAAGISAILSIGRQEDPTITNLFATITTSFAGAGPAQVETLVTTRVEDALKEIPEVHIIASTSATGISIVQVELVETVDPAMIEGIWAELRDALSDIARDFPDGALPPDLSTDGAGTFAAIVAIFAQHDDVPAGIMRRHAVELADRLRNIPGTTLVDLYGAGEEEVLVDLYPAPAAALGLDVDTVSAAVRAADSKDQAGRLRSDLTEMSLNMSGEIVAIDRVREVILREGPDGQLTRLGDIAEITRGVRQPMAEAGMHDGRPAVLVAARLEQGLQIDVWMDDLRAGIEAARAGMPGGLGLQLVFDQSVYTGERLREVGGNMALGVALVVAVLLVTLGLRAALIVALILPVVSLATLATMNLIGLAIHQMSVTGLIVALGLLVDAGIVMTDEVGQRIRRGTARIQAVRQAVRRLFAPLVASSVTTALSFMPMVLLPGAPGDFVGSIAIAVIIMLTWSLIVALTITPAIAGRVMPDDTARGMLATGLRVPVVARAFRASLVLALANPVRAVALSLVLPVLGFVSLPLLKAQFFPGVDRDQFTIEIDLRGGAPLSQTTSVAQRIDAVLRAAPETRSVTWMMGRSAPAFYYNIIGGRENAAAHAQALVTTVSPAATEALIRRLERSVDGIAPEAQVLVRGLVQGPPVSAPVELRLVGPDAGTLRALGIDLRRIVSQVPSVTLVRGTIYSGGPEIAIAVDEAAAGSLGLTLGAVSRQLEAGLEGATGGSLVEGTEELPVRVRLHGELRGDMQAIADLPLILPADAQRNIAGGDGFTPLSALATIEVVPSASIITRRNGERANTVQAFILRDVLPEEALKDVQGALRAAGFTLPPGYRLEIGGDSDARASTLRNLLSSLGIIATLSIATIVITFGSFRLTGVALVVSGLSAGLSILSLAVFNYPFGINAIIGVIGSVGVSINAAIIIMTGLQANGAASAGDREAMVDVVMGSSRHIVSTTATTFGGFLPLILAGGGFWPPFAMSVAGGVLLSTIVSFYFTPPMFVLVQALGRDSDPRGAAPRPVLRTAVE